MIDCCILCLCYYVRMMQLPSLIYSCLQNSLYWTDISHPNIYFILLENIFINLYIVTALIHNDKIFFSDSHYTERCGKATTGYVSDSLPTHNG